MKHYSEGASHEGVLQTKLFLSSIHWIRSSVAIQFPFMTTLIAIFMLMPFTSSQNAENFYDTRFEQLEIVVKTSASEFNKRIAKMIN